MSLPDSGSTGTPENPPFSPVVQLNVGGQLFSTTLATLRRFPGSRLFQLFDGAPKLRTDPQGRFFIDRDGSHFGAVLEFLRSERLPTTDIPEVYAEALHYNVTPLVKQLEETPQMFGELVGRQQFLSRVPRYRENIEVLIRIARAEAVAARRSSVLVCVLRAEEERGLAAGAQREAAVTFGPWTAAPSAADLLDCVRMDIQSRGYTVSLEPHPTGGGLLYRSCPCFYRLTFTWW